MPARSISLQHIIWAQKFIICAFSLIMNLVTRTTSVSGGLWPHCTRPPSQFVPFFMIPLLGCRHLVKLVEGTTDRVPLHPFLKVPLVGYRHISYHQGSTSAWVPSHLSSSRYFCEGTVTSQNQGTFARVPSHFTSTFVTAKILWPSWTVPCESCRTIEGGNSVLCVVVAAPQKR